MNNGLIAFGSALALFDAEDKLKVIFLFCDLEFLLSLFFFVLKTIQIFSFVWVRFAFLFYSVGILFLGIA